MSTGGNSSTPTAQQTTTTSIPSYVAPYVQDVLGKGAALTDINQNPYTPYSGQQVAGSSPLQQQAYTGAENLSAPSQFGTAANYATQAGQGMLGTTGSALNYGSSGAGYGTQGANLGITGGAQYGSQGAGYGAQATQAGQNYQNLATSPAAMQAYMNPYIQQSLQPQLQLLNQQQAIQGQDINAKAVGQGAFGGNRATLAQGLNAQNFDLARQQAIGQGYDTAFKQAQQAQQFGSNLGLQGLQTGITGANTGLAGINAQLAGTAQGMQGAQIGLQGVSGAQAGYAGANQAAGTLSGIGTAQNQANLANLQMQNQLGGQQQALNQAQLNVPYQQYQENLNYPYKQLAFQQGLFSGLPMSQSATSMYQNPNLTSQLVGLGATGLGAYGAAGGFRSKDGGAIKVKKYAGNEGSLVSSGLDVVDNMQAKLEALARTPEGLAQLAQEAQSSPSEEIRTMATRILAEVKAAEELRQQQGQGGAQAGIAAAPAPNMDSMATMANGGIIAFASRGAVEDPNADIGGLENVDRYISGLEARGYGKPTAERTQLAADIAEQRATLKDQQSNNFWQNLMLGGAKTMAGTSPNFFANLGPGIEQGVSGYAKGQKDYADMLAKLRTGEIDIAKLNATDRNNLLHYAMSGAVGEARTAEEARSREARTASETKSREQISKDRSADRALTKLQGDEAKYNTAITNRAKMLIGNPVIPPTEQQVQAVYDMAKKQIDDESSVGRPKKGAKVDGAGGNAIPEPPPGFKRPQSQG
jgi:hypothetical protein